MFRIINRKEFKELAERYGYKPSQLFDVSNVSRVSKVSENQGVCTPNETGKSESKSSDLVRSASLVSQNSTHFTHSTHINELKIASIPPSNTRELKDGEESIERKEVSKVHCKEHYSHKRIEKLNLIEAVKEVLKEGAKSEVEIYNELMTYQHEGRLEEGLLINYEKLGIALKYLEEKGIVAKTFDEREGVEKYYLLGDGND